MNDDDFMKKYEAYEREALRETIVYLIEHRERFRDMYIKKLEMIASHLLKRVQGIRKQQTVEELRCFRDVLALHHRLLENDK